MATKSVSGVKAVKATPVGSTWLGTQSNGAATPPLSARVKPLPAKVIKAVAALGEPYRLVVLGFLAAATGPVTLADVARHLDIAGHLGFDEAATSTITWLKQHGWLAADRVPKGSGGGWTYRLSDAGRERLLALGG